MKFLGELLLMFLFSVFILGNSHAQSIYGVSIGDTYEKSKKKISKVASSVEETSKGALREGDYHTVFTTPKGRVSLFGKEGGVVGADKPIVWQVSMRISSDSYDSKKVLDVYRDYLCSWMREIGPRLPDESKHQYKWKWETSSATTQILFSKPPNISVDLTIDMP